jgi:hypothetical protein
MRVENKARTRQRFLAPFRRITVAEGGLDDVLRQIGAGRDDDGRGMSSRR